MHKNLQDVSIWFFFFFGKCSLNIHWDLRSDQFLTLNGKQNKDFLSMHLLSYLRDKMFPLKISLGLSFIVLPFLVLPPFSLPNVTSYPFFPPSLLFYCFSLQYLILFVIFKIIIKSYQFIPPISFQTPLYNPPYSFSNFGAF